MGGIRWVYSEYWLFCNPLLTAMNIVSFLYAKLFLSVYWGPIRPNIFNSKDSPGRTNKGELKIFNRKGLFSSYSQDD